MLSKRAVLKPGIFVPALHRAVSPLQMYTDGIALEIVVSQQVTGM